VIGAVCGALVFWITEWLSLPEAKKPLAVSSVIFGGPGGFVVGAIIGLVVLVTNSGTASAGVIGASIGMVVAAIHLYRYGKLFVPFYLPRGYILRGVMIVVISTVIGSIMSAIVRIGI
jgi:hypothetical protein